MANNASDTIRKYQSDMAEVEGESKTPTGERVVVGLTRRNNKLCMAVGTPGSQDVMTFAVDETNIQRSAQPIKQAIIRAIDDLAKQASTTRLRFEQDKKRFGI